MEVDNIKTIPTTNNLDLLATVASLSSFSSGGSTRATPLFSLREEHQVQGFYPVCTTAMIHPPLNERYTISNVKLSAASPVMAAPITTSLLDEVVEVDIETSIQSSALAHGFVVYIVPDKPTLSPDVWDAIEKGALDLYHQEQVAPRHCALLQPHTSDKQKFQWISSSAPFTTVRLEIDGLFDNEKNYSEKISVLKLKGALPLLPSKSLKSRPPLSTAVMISNTPVSFRRVDVCVYYPDY